MNDFFAGMSRFFTNLIAIIKNFFIGIWNGLIGILSTIMPEGVAIAFAILLIAAILMITFKIITGSSNK